jgi:hypothetical protein
MSQINHSRREQMKKQACLATYALSTLLLAQGCSPDSTRDIMSPEMDVLDAPSGPSASGHGNWINPQGEYVSRTFHARENPDGMVEGNFVQHVTALTGEKRINKGDINCLLILSPTDAVLSGPIHEHMNPALIGQTQIFRIEDNGEGSDDSPDRMSGLFFRTPESGIDCRNFVPPIVTPIEGGNLQVKP